MEFIAVDISILVISLVVATAIILFYSFSSVTSYSQRYCVENFAVIDIVNTLKKLCPIGFSSKWRLLPLCLGLTRCWTKKIVLPGFLSSIHLYGVACAASCSSMYAFSMIADVAKWGEWELLPSTHSLLLKPFNIKLQKDNFMRADQVVGIQRGTDVQSYVAMYRFMSFSEKTVKWLLFWNAKKLEFMFFLIQPAISKTVESQCLITHVFGSMQLTPHIATYVSQRLKNIKEYLHLSQLNVIASNCMPAVPAVAVSTPEKRKTPANQEVRSEEPQTSGFHRTFMLVPSSQYMRHFCNRLKGFDLIVKDVHEKVKDQNQNQIQQSSPSMLEPKDSLRRSASESHIKAKLGPDVEPSTNKGSSSITSIVEENLNLDVEHRLQSKSSPPDLTRRRSEPTLKSEKRKSSSNSDGSELQTDEETYVNLHIIHEDTSGENVSPVCSYDKNDIFCSSTSEFELVDSNQQFLDCKIADFLTQGNYGASELQAEMMLASQFNKSLSPEEQTSGGWVYHSSYKGITVLSKTTAGQFMKILSFLCQCEFRAPYQDVWKCVKNPRFRFISDETVKIVKIIERISESQKLIHVYHETTGIIRKEAVDFCLLQTEREEANHFYSSYHSMEYEKCPFMTSVIRGSLRPSGWVVERLGPKRCKVTHLMQILINSPDSLFIQDLSTLVPLAMHNLKNYIAAMPK